MSAIQWLEAPLNPTPPGIRPGVVRTRDGLSLRYASWSPRPGAGPARGTVLLLQGRAEFIEKYFETIAGLQARGFAVTSFDWRSQGGSERLLPDPHYGHARHFSDFRLDYEAIRSTIDASEPVIVLAHSMGGTVALTGTHEGWLSAEGLVCINPMVGLSLVPAEAFSKRLARALARLGLASRLVPGGVSASISTLPYPGNRLTRDPGRYARNAALARDAGQNAIGSPTIGWLAAAYDAMEHLTRPGVAAAITIPVLTVLSEQDRICSTAALRRFAASLPNGRTLVVPDVEHEILMESDAALALFWKAFDEFVADALPPPGK